MSKTIYHGWIYIQRNEGFNDSFSAYSKSKPDQQFHFGQGAKGAAEAIDYFETELGLGHVFLMPTPMGLRVYTKEPLDEVTVDKAWSKWWRNYDPELPIVVAEPARDAFFAGWEAAKSEK